LIVSWPAPDECDGGGDGDKGFSDGCELLVVADEPSVLDDPSEGPLYHPAAAQHLETFCGGRAFDDLDDDMSLLPGPLHEPTSVAAIGKSVFDERISCAGCLEYQLGAIAILNVGRVDPDGKEPPIGVGQDVTLATFNFLARVIPL
jgi:hypothetical protein